ncbi:helix-turn-helix domain-containing protein [Brevibacillus panacihumi]|uniref:helix-turn-helix domain-containing protein n=1 Tax=Brevibacillus panacihumi TaxID=497735 RepID=UPI003D084841
MSNFGGRLKSLRESRGYSTKDVAEAIGVTQRTIQMYEKGSRKPDYDGLIKLADFLDVSIDYLAGRTKTP